MGFLSSLWNGIKDVGSSVKNAFSNVGSYLSQQTASAVNSLTGPLSARAGTGVGVPDANVYRAPDFSNMSVAPNMSTALGPAVATSKGITLVSPQGQAGVTFMGNSLGEFLNNSTVSNVRPSTYSTPADSTGRTSNSSVGTPYFDDKGNYVVPSQGFSGFSGLNESGNNFGNAFSTPPTTGQSGLEGLGGGSAHTGLLGAAGTGASAPTGQSDEEKRQAAQKNNGTVNLSPVTARAVQSVVAAPTVKQFLPPEVPNTIDAGYLSTVQDSLNKLASSGSALSANDRASVLSSIAQNLVLAKQKLDQTVAMPANPVIDTHEQLDFINNSSDPYGVKQAMDQFRTENTNLANLQTSRVELMKNIKALNDAYTPIVKDIKNNPDLPKALSRRRLEDLATTQKQTLQGFLDQMDIVNQQITDENSSVNRAFNIVQFANTQQNQQQDNLRQTLNIMITSGAIGGFTSQDINNWSQALDIPKSALQQAKDKALTPKLDITTNEDNKGNLVGVDKNSGKVVWTLPGFAKPVSSTPSSSTLSKSQIANGSQNAGVSVNSFTTLPVDVQNFYANAPQKQVDNFNKVVQGVSTGAMSPTDAVKIVDNTTLAPSVSTYLKQQIANSTSKTVAQDTGGFWSSLWSSIKSAF